MPASHSQENAELILALSKMGIYMERDRKQLDTMSASAQNARLKKALDRAVENCCIFPLLFTKEQREMGKLVVSGLPEWEGWRDAAKVPYAQPRARPGMSISAQSAHLEGFVKTLGTHSLYAPFQLGRASVQRSALSQGASVRLKEDVADTAHLLMGWVSLASGIDITGSQFTGVFWSLGTPASDLLTPLSVGAARTACMAVQPLAVFELQLSDDIDNEDNEQPDAAMYGAGFRGNKNRRAVPIIVVRYATALPGLGSQKNVKSLKDFANLGDLGNNSGMLAPLHLILFSHLLESNNRRLSPSEIAKYQVGVPKHIAKETKISFISPLYCPGSNVADQIEIGRRPRLSCAVCEEEASPETKLFACAACSGVMYCSAAHQSQNWQAHKPECRSKTLKLPTAIRQNPNQSSSPIVKILLPLEYRSNSDGFSIGDKFAGYMNPAERIKPPRKAYAKPQPSQTIYAHGERFLVRARWGGHADRMFGVREEDRRAGRIPKLSGKASDSQAMLEMVMGVIHFLDRPSSCSILLQKQTGVVGTSVVMMPNGRFPGMNIDNTAIFDAIVSIIKRSEKDKAEAAYFWATRKGDCLEVDLVDLPDQSLGW